VDKIAEIREKHSTGHYNYSYEVRDAIRFLLNELEQTRKESNMLREELHKFQELAIKAANHHKAERDKLIEGLRFYERLARGREVNDGGRRARTILAEIGVTVEPDRLHDARVKIAKARFSPERLISEREESGRCEY